MLVLFRLTRGFFDDGFVFFTSGFFPFSSCSCSCSFSFSFSSTCNDPPTIFTMFWLDIVLICLWESCFAPTLFELDVLRFCFFFPSSLPTLFCDAAFAFRTPARLSFFLLVLSSFSPDRSFFCCLPLGSFLSFFSCKFLFFCAPFCNGTSNGGRS